MNLFPESRETIAGTARRMRAGATSCLQVLQECLDRIDVKEPVVRAWVIVDREGATAQAQALDLERKEGRDRGPLHGIPIGVKDIIDVQGLPTSFGLAGRRWLKPQAPAERDAPLVARLREAGAVILGKTVSTPLAWIDPPLTRNPWNLDRTPGGSSSGSAAAVACGMCLGAVGTQTGGSITRPAAFCGVCGMKPSHGQISSEGVLPLAPSLDHPGPIARSVADLRILYQAMVDPAAASGVTPMTAEAIDPKWRPRLVHLKFLLGDRGPDEMETSLNRTMDLLESAGATVSYDRLGSFRYRDLLDVHHTILAAEASAAHGSPSACRKTYFDPQMPDWFFPPRVRELLEEGDGLTASRYIHATRSRKLPEQLSTLLSRADALVMPAALGAAPDPSTTGDPAYNAPWSLFGIPTVSFPIGFAADGMPLAVQLIGGAGSETNLLKTAEWCETVVRSAHRDR